MLVSADQLLAHLIGDYVLQTDGMASGKTKSLLAAHVHAMAYCLPFAAFVPSNAALIAIYATHLIIDAFRLARYVCWFRNWLLDIFIPDTKRLSWEQSQPYGQDPEKPPFLSIWVLIIVDNTLHILINGLALKYL